MSTLSNREKNALDQADELLDAAVEATSSEDAVEAALRAIRASPLCADAYVFLAIHGGYDGHEALQVWRSGLAAAETCLQDSFKRYRGEFWDFLETRPYMRAKHGLAMALIDMGQPKEAIGHLEEMLELNPNDNQGARYVLLELYLAGKKDAAARELLKRYPEEWSAWFAWAPVLLNFRKGGAKAAMQALDAAMKCNNHVRDYLTGKRKQPKIMPEYYQAGSAEEAQLYAQRALLSWDATEGALEWLVATSKAAKTRR